MIEIININKSFRMGEETVHALKDINLKIKDGEFISLIGPSGSGKTTLLNLIGGIEVPDNGKIQIDGQDITKLKDNQLSHFRGETIGNIFQTFNILPRFNVLKNILLPAMILKINRRARYEKALALLKAVGLQGKEKYLPNKLSGGERQRVSIARALINNPAIILADEPTGNLDANNAKKVMDLIINLCKEYETDPALKAQSIRAVSLEKFAAPPQDIDRASSLRQAAGYSPRTNKKTLILVTHNKELADRADRTVIINNGRLSGGVK